MEKSLAGVEFLPEATVREGLALSEKATPRPYTHCEENEFKDYCIWGPKATPDSVDDFIANVGSGNPANNPEEGVPNVAFDLSLENAAFLTHAANHYVSLANEVLARRKAMEDAPHWRPISTAPIDGTRILAIDNGRLEILHFDKGSSYSEPSWRDCQMYPGYQPTHWMPLPNPPKWSAEREGE